MLCSTGFSVKYFNGDCGYFKARKRKEKICGLMTCGFNNWDRLKFVFSLSYNGNGVQQHTMH